MLSRYIRNQLVYIAVLLHNTIYNILPFFIIKNFYLRIVGNKIGKQTYIHTPIRFMHHKKLNIGDNVHIGFNCNLDARCSITIGNNVTIGPYSKLLSIGHDFNDPYYSGKGSEIIIEKNVVFFYDCTILPGVKIAEGAVILTGSVVTKDVEAYSVVGGNPAKFIKKRKKEIKYKINQSYWFSC